MMMHSQAGFKIVELLIGIAILAIAVAIAVPRIAKSREKARELEVKHNIHIIQIALARYAVDFGGRYPPFLIGAEADYNIIKAHIDPAYKNAARIKCGVTPFAKRRDPTLAEQEYCFITEDPLIKWGYLYAYPHNPFAKRDNGLWNASFADNHKKSARFPYGGLHGDRMFDLGFGYGDTPQTDFIYSDTDALVEATDDGKTVFAEPDLDAPGNFYYHPIFADHRSPYIHYVIRYNKIYGDDEQGKLQNVFAESDYSITRDPISPDNQSIVDGFYLYGYGNSIQKARIYQLGLDIFNRMPGNYDDAINKFFHVDNVFSSISEFTGIFRLDTTIEESSYDSGREQIRCETTGYPAAEYDPWSGAFSDGLNPDDPDGKYKKSGADGILDWAIIEVTSGCVPTGDDSNPYLIPKGDSFRYSSE